MRSFKKYLLPKVGEREHDSRGFTLIELMVVISLMVILGALVLSQNRSGRDGLETTNLAYEVALLLREAQSYGVAVREEDIGAGEFDIGYGVYLDEDVPDRLILFRDLDKNISYSGSDTILKELTLGNGYDIVLFCGETSGGSQTCSNESSLNEMTIAFVRPNPDAQIVGEPSGTSYGVGQIYLRAPSGFQKMVSVYVTGQISIDTP